MARKTASIITLGCKLNQYESEQMREQLESLGYTIIDYDEGADLCIVNTCTVTGRTDRESRRLARRAKRLNPDAYVCVTGCYVNTTPEDLEEIEQVDLVFPNEDKGRIAELVPPPDTAAEPEKITEPLISHFSGHTRAFVRVQEGCDQYCAYCIIPYARGPSRSTPSDEVIQQCRILAEAGHPEVILIGTHVGRYGEDLDEGITLAEITGRIAELSISRIRISSIEPREVADRLIKMVEKGGRIQPDPNAPAKGKLCRHFHIPLQSGCDSVLERMGRPYDSQFYERLIRRIKDVQPACCIGADVIVGFPGETDEEFETTWRFIEELPLSYLHVFTYSNREGTRAAQMPDQVDHQVRKDRNHILRNISEQKRAAFAETMVGESLGVVLQTARAREESLLEAPGCVNGVSDNYLQVEVPRAEDRIGELVEVNIVGTQGARLIASEPAEK